MKDFKFKKLILVAIAALLIAEAGVFGFATSVKAIVGPTPVMVANPEVPVYDVALDKWQHINSVEDVIKIGVVGAALSGLLNTVNYFAQKLAYDTAEAISEGNWDKSPLFNPKGWGDFLEDVGNQAVGFVLDEMNKTGVFPFDLCDPNNFRLKIAMALGWIDARAPKKPRCNWNALKQNYKTFGERVRTGEALKQFAVALEPGESGLGVAVETSSRLRSKTTKLVNAQSKDREEGSGFKPLTDPISGSIRTPAQVIFQKAIEGSSQGGKAQELSYEIMGKAIVSAPGMIATAAMSTFVNHLVSKLLKRAIGNGLYWTLYDATCYLGITGCGGVSDSRYGASVPGSSDLKSQNAGFITPPLQQDQHYDPVSEFVACPDQGRNINNCVLDTQFAAALARGSMNQKLLTIREALDQGYLHGDWPLISNSESHRARNADPYCFANSYCYSNLVKLRKHRVLPIGWELAAAKSPSDPVKLSEVIAKFDDCPTAEDPNPANHPWCHLIDPNWILKMPVTQCRLRVYGATLLSPEAPNRAQYCADTPSCVAEDRYGNCVSGYGYCAREKNIWRLGGAECKAPYASCAAFSNTGGESLLALQTTIDHGVCTAENVGCRPYQTLRNRTSAANWYYIPGFNRVFLNRDAVECDEKDAGCSKLIDKEGLRRNLVYNPSFEENLSESLTQLPRYWLERGALPETWNNDSALSRSGNRSVLPKKIFDYGPIMRVPTEPNQTYTVSYYARQDAASGNGEAKVDIRLIGSSLTTFKVIDIGYDSSFYNCEYETIPFLGQKPILKNKPQGTDWERVSCTFTIPPLVYKGYVPVAIELAMSRTSADKVYIDDVQVEEGSLATDFHETAYDGGAAKTMKVPPEYLMCVGDPKYDAPDCGRYAAVCRADEVGCDRYAPALGGTAITAVTASQDYCPSECVGYQTFREEKSEFDLADYPKYFIPDTAAKCTAAAAGCTEFTNLDALGQGGEAREYFSYIRKCEKPSGVAPTYYTWEGSDTTGYQLKEWHLKRSVTKEGNGYPPEGGADPSCNPKNYQNGLAGPDCREFYDTEGNVSYRLYSKTIVITDDCHPYRITAQPEDSLVYAPKKNTPQETCESLDAQGGYHWIGTDATNGVCRACEAIGGEWRKETTECIFWGYRQESALCRAEENGCRLFTGNAGGNIQNVLFEDFETGLGGWDDAIKNSGVAMASSTESTVVGGTSLRIARSTKAVWRAMTTGTPAGLEEKGIYFVDFWAKGPSMKIAQVQLRNPKTAGQTGFVADPTKGPELTGNWKYYSLGPLILSFDPNKSDSGGVINLDFIGDGDSQNEHWFLDNLRLRKVGSAVSVIQNSWKTPPACDQTNGGVTLPQAQLGCSAYTDRKNASVALKSFEKLCRDAAVGCRSFVDTRNSDFPGFEYWNAMAQNLVGQKPTPVDQPTPIKLGEDTLCTVATNNVSCRFHQTSSLDPLFYSFNRCSRVGPGRCYVDGVYLCTVSQCGPKQECACVAPPPDLISVLPDRTVYLVDDEKFSCDSTQAGCTEVGSAIGSVCKLNGPCAPLQGATTCQCWASTEVCAPGQECKIENQFKCSVAAGKTSCEYALPDKEPYPLLSYANKNLILDPARYSSQVCTSDAVGCDEWRSSSKNAPSLSYFKNPDGRYCEYRENVSQGTGVIAGYFIQGTDQPCDPTYLVNGNYYGVRKTSDPNYHGFVGSCPSDQNGCTEYIDPADWRVVKQISKTEALTEPERYYYIKDQNIDYGSCSNQVSQKDGCVLLNDTSDQNLYYNANGTYSDSAGKNYGLVAAKPGVCQYALGSCEGGVDPSFTSRLAPGYLMRSLHPGQGFEFLREPMTQYNATYFKDGLTRGELDQLCNKWNPSKTGEAVSIYYDGSGCYSDKDCGRDGLVGYCRLDKKDSNSVIKVARDRVCGAWYSCKSSTPQWDPRINSFRETCDEIGLCDETAIATNSSPSVDVTSCKHWVSGESPNILSEQIYRERDVSWTGLDYSGYAVPHMFPMNALSQASIGRYCAWSGERCQSDADCPHDGKPSPCVSRTALARDIGGCDEDGKACGASGEGVCYSHRCYISAYGNPDMTKLDEPQPLYYFKEQNMLPLSCRAYPESDSPVPSDVVTDWGTQDPTLPYRTKQGFENANRCEKDATSCECSYAKTSYGASQGGKGGTVKYYGAYDTRSASGVCGGGPYDGMVCNTVNDPGGEKKKRGSTDRGFTILSCSDHDLEAGETPSGTCLGQSRVDMVQGLQGYCLERDEATPIYAHETSSSLNPSRACLTWLPIDRLSGVPDIFNQYISATYSVTNDYMCLVPQEYKVVHTYGEGDNAKSVGVQTDDQSVQKGHGARSLVSWGTGFPVYIGCASTGGDDLQKDFPKDVTEADYHNVGHGNPFVDCPPATGWLLISANRKEDCACMKSTRTDKCGQGGEQVDICGSDTGTGPTSFKYVCIPWGSVHMSKQYGLQGKECTPADFPSNMLWDTTDSVASIYPDGICSAYAGSKQWLGAIKAGFCHDLNVTPRFESKYWPEESTVRKYMQQGDGTYTVVVTNLCREFALGRVSDCVKLDAPVYSDRTQPYWGASHNAQYGVADMRWLIRDALAIDGALIPEYPGRYPACSLVAQVSKLGTAAEDVNKALTERFGSGALANTPLVTGHDETNYTAKTEPTPYGLGKLKAIDPTQSRLPIPSNWTQKKDPDPKKDVSMPYLFFVTGLETLKHNPDICDAPVGSVKYTNCYSYGSDNENKYNVAAGYAHQLFAKMYSYFGWSFHNDPATNKPRGYIKLPEYWTQVLGVPMTGYNDFKAEYGILLWDSSLTSPTNAQPENTPQIWGITSCDVTNRCAERDVGTFTINNLSDGVIKGGGGSKRATFKFFASAGLNADPIRDVVAIYDVTRITNDKARSPYPSLGFYKNHRGFVSDNKGGRTSLCNNKTFAQSSGACDDSAPFTFVHNYQCNNTPGHHCEIDDGTDYCWQWDAESNRMACVYYPAVYVLNNWGLCASRSGCPGGAAGNLCSNDWGTDNTVKNRSEFGKQAGQIDECDLNDNDLILNKGNKPYILFNGRVIVYPDD